MVGMTRHEMRRQWREDNAILQLNGLESVSFQTWFELKLVADELARENSEQ
jgi:hypothetical protein